MYGVYDELQHENMLKLKFKVMLKYDQSKEKNGLMLKEPNMEI